MSDGLFDRIMFWRPDEEMELDLREFIYLDGVSVISLLASLTREITESRTDSETTEKQKKWRHRFMLKIKGVFGLGTNRETLRIDRNTEEVVRRSEIQSKFDELYNETVEGLELAEGDESVSIPVSNLRQGGVMEIGIEFSAHELFHFYKAYEYLFDVFEEHAEDLDQEQKQIIQLMGSLFGDQVPVMGEAINYRVVDDEIRSLDEIEDDEEDEALQIVGTLDPEMLSPDPSQILYEENQFTAYVRIPDPKIQKEWDPVKLTKVIKSISKPVGDRLSRMIDFGLQQAKEELDEADLQGGLRSGGLVEDHHNTYFDHIEDSEGIDIDEDWREELIRRALTNSILVVDDDRVEVQTTLLKEVTDILEEEGLDLDRDELSDLRLDLISGLDDAGEVVSKVDQGNYLEVSFVAIYW